MWCSGQQRRWCSRVVAILRNMIILSPHQRFPHLLQEKFPERMKINAMLGGK